MAHTTLPGSGEAQQAAKATHAQGPPTLPPPTAHRRLQVLWRTYGKDLLIAGIWKLLWSLFVIMGGAPAAACAARRHTHSS